MQALQIEPVDVAWDTKSRRVKDRCESDTFADRGAQCQRAVDSQTLETWVAGLARVRFCQRFPEVWRLQLLVEPQLNGTEAAVDCPDVIAEFVKPQRLQTLWRFFQSGR
jgi:hypothetical protein